MLDITHVLFIILMFILLNIYINSLMSRRIYGAKDPAFEVILPGEGKEKLFMIGVVVKGYNHETALQNYGQAKIYGSYVNIREVEEFEDDEGKVAFRDVDSKVN